MFLVSGLLSSKQEYMRCFDDFLRGFMKVEVIRDVYGCVGVSLLSIDQFFCLIFIYWVRE